MHTRATPRDIAIFTVSAASYTSRGAAFAVTFLHLRHAPPATLSINIIYIYFGGCILSFALMLLALFSAGASILFSITLELR